jgi:hypothetical protein
MHLFRHFLGRLVQWWRGWAPKGSELLRRRDKLGTGHGQLGEQLALRSSPCRHIVSHY